MVLGAGVPRAEFGFLVFLLSPRTNQSPRPLFCPPGPLLSPLSAGAKVSGAFLSARLLLVRRVLDVTHRVLGLPHQSRPPRMGARSNLVGTKSTLFARVFGWFLDLSALVFVSHTAALLMALISYRRCEYQLYLTASRWFPPSSLRRPLEARTQMPTW